MKKGINMNLKIVMVVVVLMITLVFVLGVASDNVNFLADYGNSTINGSMGNSLS